MKRPIHATLAVLLVLPCAAASEREAAEARAKAALAVSLASRPIEPKVPPCPYGCCVYGCECVLTGSQQCNRQEGKCLCYLARKGSDVSNDQKAPAVLTVYCLDNAVVLIDGEPVGTQRGIVRNFVSDPFSPSEQHTYTVEAGRGTRAAVVRTVTVRGGGKVFVDLRPGHADHGALAAPPVVFPAMPQMGGPPVLGGSFRCFGGG